MARRPTFLELLLDAGVNRVLGAFVEAGEHRIINLFTRDQLDHNARGKVAHFKRTLSDQRPVVVAELTGDLGPAAVEFLDRKDYRMWDLELGRPLEDGHHPFMVVAIPEETLAGERGLLIQEAVGVIRA